MSIKLVKLSVKYKKQLEDMLDEWTEYNRTHVTNTTPWAIFKNDYHNFDYYLENLEVKEECDGKVPDSTYFMLDEERNIFIGAANIRHYLSENLLNTGGHIGDGIRPSERRKGYGTLLVKLALDECRKLGIKQALMSCNQDNIGSKKAILNNGGIFFGTYLEDGELCERYWVNTNTDKSKTNDKINLIFDFDGTLFDSYDSIVDYIYKCLEACDIKEDRNKIKELCLYHNGIYAVDLILKEHNMSKEEYENRTKEIERDIESIKPYPHVKEILSNNRYNCFIYTHRGETAQQLICKFGLTENIIEVVDSTYNFQRKPSSEGIDYLINKYNLNKKKTYYIGDRSIDIECGNNANVKTIFYRSSNIHIDLTKADYIVKDLIEIDNLIL